MISLTVVIIILAMTFGGAYLVYKLNKDRALHPTHPAKRSPSQRHH